MVGNDSFFYSISQNHRKLMKKTALNIAIEDRYLNYLIDIFDSEIGSIPTKIILYGSRAIKNFHPTSDIDLAVKSAGLSPVYIV